jgi:hypothetical protein
MTYTITFTPSGRALAEAHSSLAAVEERVRRELADLLGEEIGPVDRLLFHTFALPSGHEFIVTPLGSDAVEIDTCSRASLVIREGPLAGQDVAPPMKDSD